VTAEEPVDVEVPALLEGVRLDRAVAMLTGVSRSEACALVERGAVAVDGREVRARSRLLNRGDRLQIRTSAHHEAALQPDPDVPLRVVHADEHLVVVDKPAGVVVHPGAGRADGTLVNGLLARFPDLADLAAATGADSRRPGIVHRLDKGTSGLLVVARTELAYRSLVDQLSRRAVERRYVALAHGRLEEDRGVVEAPIGRSARSPVQMAVSSQGRDARTRYRVIARYEDPEPCVLLVLGLDSGRTHQIRVHLSAIGHPLVGDGRYRKGRRGALDAALDQERVFLHAIRLGFEHPATGRHCQWHSPVPDDLSRVVDIPGAIRDGGPVPEP
jgi:23S rRNA pseudouridine1911/1915/1917 synthase